MYSKVRCLRLPSLGCVHPSSGVSRHRVARGARQTGPNSYTWTPEIAKLHGMASLNVTPPAPDEPPASDEQMRPAEVGEDPNDWGKYAGGRLSGKKTGYQNFASKHFAWVSSWVLAENLCVEKEVREPEHRQTNVWRELALEWKALSEKQREHWKAFAKGKAAMPVMVLSDWRTPRPTPDEAKPTASELPTTHQIDKLAWERVEYLAKHNLQKTLDDAINAAIDAQSPDPKIFIAHFLASPYGLPY